MAANGKVKCGLRQGFMQDNNFTSHTFLVDIWLSTVKPVLKF